MSKRPEHRAPPEIFYGSTEARKYTNNSRIISVQNQLAERALELLALPEEGPSLLLDLGCGSGLCGEVLSEGGHYWIGMDISQDMLDIALEREVEGDVILSDIGFGIPFRPGSFNGAISISALQWLCNADKIWHNPAKRMRCMFSTLYACLARGARAVFQIYPENSHQIELMTQQAMYAGFTGGLIVDFPNSSKAKKMFLCFFAGGAIQSVPRGLDASSSVEQHTQGASFSGHRQRNNKRVKRLQKKSAGWIMKKKDQWRRKGKDVRADSKYTGRKRHHKF